MIQSKRLFASLLTVGVSALAACDPGQFSGSKKDNGENRVFQSSFAADWYVPVPDDFHDGAIRTRIVTIKDSRVLTLRCFRATPRSERASTDLRYTIQVPLLGRSVADLERLDTLKLVVSVDDVAVAIVPTRAHAHDFGVSFLAPLEPWLIDKLAEAKSSVVVMPRLEEKALDKPIRFGVGALAGLVGSVKAACDLPARAVARRPAAGAGQPKGPPGREHGFSLPAIPDPRDYCPRSA
jgi:hypothetical protein